MSIIIIHCHAFLKIKGLVIVRFCYMSFYLTSKEPGFHCWTMARSILNPVFLPRVAVNECYYFKNKHDPKRPVHTLHIHLDKQRCTQDSGQYFQVKVLLEGSKHCCAR